MCSQKSIVPVAEALVPKRKRGHDRVDAIMCAATVLFIEKGFDAVTMSEVAARSSTAIGSLYRFFPTKEVLVGALLERYGAELAEAIDAIAERPDGGTPAGAAAALVEVVERMRLQRSAVLVLIDTHRDSPALRQAMRGAVVGGLERLLAHLGAVPGEDTHARAVFLLYLLKTAWAVDQEGPAMLPAYRGEIAQVMERYLAAACNPAAQPLPRGEGPRGEG
jgi:AcrR family transcriptional regulator